MLDSWIGPSDIEHRPVLLFQWQDDNGAWPYDVYRSRGDEFGDWKVLRSMSATQRVNMQAGCNRAAAMLQSYRPYAPGRTTLLDTTEVGSAVCDCQHDSRTPGQINSDNEERCDHDVEPPAKIDEDVAKIDKTPCLANTQARGNKKDRSEGQDPGSDRKDVEGKSCLKTCRSQGKGESGKRQSGCKS